MTSPLLCRRLTIRGRVQGVGFRASTRYKAAALGLTGWVRNLPNGDVEVLAWGAPAAVEALIDWCRQGPSAARVLGMELDEGTPEAGLHHFEVR